MKIKALDDLGSSCELVCCVGCIIRIIQLYLYLCSVSLPVDQIEQT